DLTRSGVMAAPQIKRRYWPQARNLFTTWERLRELCRAGYIACATLGVGQEAAYLPTGRGVAVTGLALPPPRCRPEFRTAVWHYLSVGDLADALLARFPGGQWTTERELRRAHGGARAAVPPRGTIPDGVLTVAGRRMAVECELTLKAAAAYARSVARYRRHLAAGAFDRVQWFVLGAGAQRQLARAIQRDGDGRRMCVAALPAGVTIYGHRGHDGRP
ncbi:MAG: hypothetical protein ACRDJN_21240, partial [Chloroflexota bacterium]